MATKFQLRAAARAVLENRGHSVTVVGGAGVVPGARVALERDGLKSVVAIRTASDRELGLLRHPSGEWKTIPKMDAVVVAAPARDQLGEVEVSWFEVPALLAQFDAELAARRQRGTEPPPKVPIFLPLDPDARHPLALLRVAKWTERVAAMTVERQESAASFIDRVKREFAALHGVDVRKVSVEFRIVD
jgi:hypothetical protein